MPSIAVSSQFFAAFHAGLSCLINVLNFHVQGALGIIFPSLESLEVLPKGGSGVTEERGKILAEALFAHPLPRLTTLAIQASELK